MAALLLHADGHELVYAAVCREGAPGTRRLVRTLGAERVGVVPDARRELPRLRRAAPELVVSWFWTKKLPRDVLELAPLGALGVHPSLLPRHRGPDPFFHAIDAGDAETGVTVHELEEAYDTGRVLAQERLAVGARDAWALARALDRPSLRQLRRVVGALARGERPAAVAQDERAATWAGAPTDDDLELRWSWPAERLVRRIRAAAPWPGAYTELGGRVLVITRAEATDDVPRALAPGEAAVRGDGTTVVRAGRGGVVLLRARFEDGDGPEDAPALGPAELAELVRGAGDAPDDDGDPSQAKAPARSID